MATMILPFLLSSSILINYSQKCPILSFQQDLTIIIQMNNQLDIDHIHSMVEGQSHRGNLYLGSISVLNYLQAAKEIFQLGGILTILDDQTSTYQKVKDKTEKAKFSILHRINLQDDQQASIFPHFEETYQFITNNLPKTNIFVHCRGGVSRSSSLVIAFLMKTKGIGREEATNYVKQRRHCISPNSTFWKQLLQWEDQLKSKAVK